MSKVNVSPGGLLSVSGKSEVMRFVPGDFVRLSFEVKEYLEVIVVRYDGIDSKLFSHD